MQRIVDSRYFGGNFRSEPSFGDNIIGFLNQNAVVEVTGTKMGDRWIPCSAQIDEDTKQGFISNNILREPESEQKEALMRLGVMQWLRFNKGEGKEHVDPFSGYVGDFWSALGMDIDGSDRDIPWSAAFISWCVKSAGGYPGFRYSAAHSKYANQAIRRKLDNVNGPFWGYKISEIKPSLGDLICRSRNGSNITYSFAAKNSAYKSHCDIVVRVTPRYVVTIGGNLSDSVNRYNYSLNTRGYIDKSTHAYAILKNRR